MTGALSPPLALAYLRELQPCVGDAAIGAPGEPLSGEAGAVRARSENREIAILPGDCELQKLLEHDARRVAEVLNR